VSHSEAGLSFVILMVIDELVDSLEDDEVKFLDEPPYNYSNLH
jgi:hypothetical protein